MSCSILILSCDKYKACWKPMAQSLDKYWKNCTYKRYICSEKEEDNINYDGAFHSQCKQWGARFLEYLNQIDSEYVLVILEDLWIGSEIDSHRVDEALEVLVKDDSVGVCFLSKKPETMRYNAYSKEGYVEILQDEIYRISTAPGIWRKNFLVKILREDDSPWEFERKASNRVETRDMKVLFLKSPVYSVFHSGGSVSRGKWALWAKKWAKKNDIDVDWDELPSSSIVDTIKFYLKSVIFNINPRFFTKVAHRFAK